MKFDSCSLMLRSRYLGLPNSFGLVVGEDAADHNLHRHTPGQQEKRFAVPDQSGHCNRRTSPPSTSLSLLFSRAATAPGSRRYSGP